MVPMGFYFVKFIWRKGGTCVIEIEPRSYRSYNFKNDQERTIVNSF